MNRSGSDPERDPDEKAGEFLSRWSRRKQQAREQEKAEPEKPAADAGKAPVLPPVEELGMDSDYRDFFHPKVDEGVRRAALKKLFSDPHFSIIDGLDIYLDDYSISEPIPPAMLAGLKQAQNILGWAKERKEAEAARERAAEGKTAEATAALPADADAATVPPATAPQAATVVARPAPRDDDPQNA